MLLHDLAPELQLHILSFLVLPDLRHVYATSRHFHDLLAEEILVHDLTRWRDLETVLCLKVEAVDGQTPDDHPQIDCDVGPFVLRGFDLATQSGSDSELGHKVVHLEIYKPVFWRGNDEVENLDLEMCCTTVEIEHGLQNDEDREREWAERDKSRDAKLTMTIMQCRENIILCTGKVMRWNYDCPECGGNRFICPGCGGVSGRWEDLFCSCGWDMPCPVCIGYQYASEAKYLSRGGDIDQEDNEDLEQLYNEINEAL